MTLVSLKEILIKARQGKYAVGSFNIMDLQSLRAVIKAADEENSPVIVAFGEAHKKYMPFDIIFPLMARLAKRATIPVAVLLDHGKSFEANVTAIKYGATGVMYDGSDLPFDLNIKHTSEVVKVAHSVGVSVEAELGHVAMEEGNPDRSGAETEEPIYTNPEDVETFVEQTGVDALAVSIGTSHGVCLEAPKLDFERLNEINSISPVPLVLHGGSGVTDDDFRNCVRNGITKINYFSNISNFVAESLKKKLNEIKGKVYYQDSSPLSFEFFKEAVKERMRVFSSNNKA
ncbi:MAG: ketose-bisphosphate aldolase [Candidatus Lokiarchaeota archaeon]|nr:ketose-bisphosphate aldolase [Candidatus Lokiarchaeota archaeon]MBD3341973.1 ketose-bisphosphate aldolase [Candidatus Lokiarchaeota archaeon]